MRVGIPDCFLDQTLILIVFIGSGLSFDLVKRFQVVVIVIVDVLFEGASLLLLLLAFLLVVPHKVE